MLLEKLVFVKLSLTVLLFLAGFLLLAGCIGQPPAEPESQHQEQIYEPVQTPRASPSAQRATPSSPSPQPSKPDNETETQENQSLQRVPCSRVFSPKFNAGAYYEGPLFDAHFHLPSLDFSVKQRHDGESPNPVTDPVLGKDVELEKILCNFDKEKVRGAIGFLIGAEEVKQETLEKSRQLKNESFGRINLFLFPSGFRRESLEEIEKNYKGLFQGYGEIAFYNPYYADKPPDSLEMLEVYKIAGKNNLIVMFHPDGRQENSVENAIKKNPNVKFLVHGPEAEDYTTNLMGKYPNAYYSIDAILVRIPPSPAALMYTVGSKQEFLSKFQQNFNLMLNEAEDSWKSKIEQYPDRFMWGTDRAHEWTYDEEVSVLVEEFARAFIGRLNPGVREKFAYQNAEKLLERR